MIDVDQVEEEVAGDAMDVDAGEQGGKGSKEVGKGGRTKGKGKGKAKATGEVEDEEEIDDEDVDEIVLPTTVVNDLDSLCTRALFSYTRVNILEPPAKDQYGAWNDRPINNKKAADLADVIITQKF